MLGPRFPSFVLFFFFLPTQKDHLLLWVKHIVSLFLTSISIIRCGLSAEPQALFLLCVARLNLGLESIVLVKVECVCEAFGDVMEVGSGSGDRDRA